MGITFKAVRVRAEDVHTQKDLRSRLYYGAVDVLDLDKAWDGVLWLTSEERRERPYMLPDPSDPETWALMPPGRLHDEREVGVLTPLRVSQVAGALARFDAATLRAHFDPAAMEKADVYPSIWDDDDAYDYLATNFEALRRFYVGAAAAGDAVISIID